MSAEVVASLFFLQSLGRKKDLVSIGTISASFRMMDEIGIHLAVALKRIPGGLYSEDVEAFVGRLCGAGYAQVGDDRAILLTRDGVRICSEILIDAARGHMEDFRVVVGNLHIDLAAVMSAIIIH